MILDLPTLRIVPTTSVRLHEEFDEQRAHAIGAEMKRQGILTHPPIVAPIEGKRSYLLLDGANRVTAARRIDLPSLLVQVVDYDDPSIILDAWAHVVGNFPEEIFFEGIERMRGARAERTSRKIANEKLDARKIACYYFHKRRGTFAVHSAHKSEVRFLRELTGIYKDRALIRRVKLESHPKGGLAAYRDLLVAFPKFRKKDIVRFALSASDKLPTGISRHTIPGRALRVNLPLELLYSSVSLGVKNGKLAEFIDEKSRRNSIRLYSEPTYIYDE